MCHFAYRGGGGWSNHHRVGPQAEVDMAVPRTVTPVEKLAHHSVAAEGGEGERCDKLLGGWGHHDLHLSTGFDKQAHQGASLVGGNAARDAEHDVFAFEHGGKVAFREVRKKQIIR